MFNSIPGWEEIIKRRIHEIRPLIIQPKYLVENSKHFTGTIETYLINQLPMYDSFERRAEMVYSIIVPLDKHFKGEEEQTFISNIDDRTYKNALNRIEIGHWEIYKTKQIRMVQSIPSTALRNNNGMAVGRGLRTTGTIKYWCDRCNMDVGFTPEAYWDHQEQVHNNSRVRIVERSVNYKL
jgi:hypothetical protein